MRERCLRCRRPVSVCYCATLPSIPTRTRVILLQHPRERDMPIGTARMAALALPNAKLHVGYTWDGRVVPADAILLYPGEGAKNILTEPPPEPVTLVVVDGTWSQAKVLVRDNPVLNALPRYAFAAPELSRYRIRKEPRAEYCSTIEALMHVLGVLEGDPERFRALLVPFERMIDTQLAAQASAPKREMRRILRGKRSPIVPVEITEALAQWDELVCVVAEANAWPFVAGGDEPGSSNQVRADRRPDELLHLLAYRMRDGASFERLVRPKTGLAPATTFHLRLTADELAAGVAPEDALADFAAFLGPTDRAVAWGHHGLELIAAAGGALPQRPFDLRDAARRRVNRVTPHRRIGTLETYAATIGEAEPHGRGRGGERLGMLVTILRSWR